MDASDPMSSPSDPGKGDEAAAVVVTATTPTPAPISEHSPAAPPPAAPSSSESITKPTSPALPPTTPAPPVQPPRCLGARGYDGGFYDVGSFFVFRHGPQPPQVVTQDEAPASAEGAAASGGDLVELFGAGPSSAPSRKTAAAAAAATAPSPLQFVLLDGLSLRGACSGKGELEGDGKETAARAFVVLQRQADFLGQALGCGDTPSPKAKKARSDSGDGDSDSKMQDAPGGADESKTPDGVTSSSAAGNGVMAANGSKDKQPSQPQQQEKSQELFALSNTEDNDSLQGLVGSGGCLWIGRFGLPPTPPGEDESEVVDLWPRKVTRVVGGGVGEGSAEPVTIRPLEGKPDALGPLTVLKEEQNDGSGEVAAEMARRAHELIVQALAELRPHVPPPSPVPPEEMQQQGKGGRASSPSSAPRTSANGAAGSGGNAGGGASDHADGDEALQSAGGGKGKAAAPVGEDSEQDDTEEERTGSAHGGGGRRGRKRQRAVEDDGVRAGEASRSNNNNSNNDDRELEDQNGVVGGGGGHEDDNSEEEEEGDGEEDDSGPGADEMTVAAVRGSLLRNGSDVEGGAAAAASSNRQEEEIEEWEVVVKKFIRHVESLPPGTEQEELSLMFAAALDPTLVRMRAANTALVRLAEACCASSSSSSLPPTPHSGDGADIDDDDDENTDGGASPGKKTNSGSAAKAAPGKEETSSGRYGFKVRLELEATAEGAPPPDGVAGVLRAVAVAAAAVESAARAEECVAHAGDTLGGLRELRLDYKRSLPPGPREPIQFIIAEEQARVLGYVSAHEEVLRTACEKVRAAGAKVGDAYRAVETEAGWEEVKPQVDAFLVKFEGYCESLMPTMFTGGGILGVDLTAARDDSASRKPAPVDDDGGDGDAAAAAAAAPEEMEDSA